MVLLTLFMGGCQLKEIRSKTKFGPEFRHKGSDSTNAVRWTVQQGLDFKWKQGWTTGITYRRRDTDDGSGDNDNGDWIDFSFPIWKAPKNKRDHHNETSIYIDELRQRIAKLEGMHEAVIAKLQRDRQNQQSSATVSIQNIPQGQTTKP